MIKKTLKKIYRYGFEALLSVTQIYFLFFKNKVECNLCLYKANHLKSTKWHLHSQCPNCTSEVRQRLIWASLNQLEKFGMDKLLSGKDVLHFAPEKSMSGLIQKSCGTYRTADMLAEGYSISEVDYDVDISKMKKISDNSFDLIIACDVLEHVPDDKAAIKEVFRALRKGGYCIFTIPQKDNLEKTFEDPAVKTPEERKKVYGQWDHLRIYGNDFPQFMTGAGFEVTAVNDSFFPDEMIKKYVLAPPVLSSHPLATNYRKIFFGKKV